MLLHLFLFVFVMISKLLSSLCEVCKLLIFSQSVIIYEPYPEGLLIKAVFFNNITRYTWNGCHGDISILIHDDGMFIYYACAAKQYDVTPIFNQCKRQCIASWF